MHKLSPIENILIESVLILNIIIITRLEKFQEIDISISIKVFHSI